jgi:hypothetical protein
MTQDDLAMPAERIEEQDAADGPSAQALTPIKADEAGEAPKLDVVGSAGQVDYLSVIFRDGLDMPLVGLEFIATLPSGEMCTVESTQQGAVTLPIPTQATGEIKIEVKDTVGKQQTVCRIDLDKCDKAVIVRSPKTKATVPLRPHQQTPTARSTASDAAQPKTAASTSPPATKPAPVDTHASWWGVNGAWQKAWDWLKSEHHFLDGAHAAPVPAKPTAAKGLSTAGQPVTAVIGPESPNKDNLRLGRNNVYREAILGASQRLGLIPQALCALMDCEAGKVAEKVAVLNPDGSPAKDKKGRPLTRTVRELWNANAGNAESGAAGLTQFLGSTWLTHVLIPGYYIHDKSVANGWVRQDKDAKGKLRWVFVLSDGTTTSKPYEKRNSDGNVKKCLAMRMDPTWSIHAAADYGNANLKVLVGAGFKLTGLNDMEKAKLMYLMHHEGEGCGPLFVKNRLRDRKDGVGGVARQKQVFSLQLGKNGAEKVAELIDRADGDVEFAYRGWLSQYIDTQFGSAGKYFFVAPIENRPLSKLMVQVGGEKL